MTRKTSDRLMIATLVLILATLTAAATLRARAVATASRTQREPVVLGMSALRISLPVFVAESRGLFRRRGLDVRLKVYDTAQPLAEEVADGRIDAGGYVAWPIVLLAAQRAQEPPSAVTSIVEDGAHRLSYVLARRGAGLRFPQDVRGKRVGILPTVAYRKWLEAMLRTSGIDPGDVTILPVAPALQAQTLAGGGVDLLFTNDPMATAMLGTGVAEVADPAPACPSLLGDPFAFGTFALSARLVRERPAVARALVDALDEAIGDIRADQAAARRTMIPHLRPQERAWVDQYPDARYLGSRETTSAMFEAEVERERRFGILSDVTRVTLWEGDAAR